MKQITKSDQAAEISLDNDRCNDSSDIPVARRETSNGAGCVMLCFATKEMIEHKQNVAVLRQLVFSFYSAKVGPCRYLSGVK